MLNRLLSKWYFPVLLKYLSLVAYIVLIVMGLIAYPVEEGLIKELRNTNLGNLIVWSYWWPAIVVLAIVFGRIWCMVCPIEIITSFFAKIGLKRNRPKWLLSGWAITVFYLLILFIGIQGFSIHRNPFYMAIYLLVIAVTSIVLGAIYEKNTFCRYVCPVGYLLGLYSRLSFFGWRVKDKSVCDNCKDKSCVHKKYQYNLNAKSCGVDLYPAKITDNTDCILCAGCLKTCNQYQSQTDTGRPNPGFRYIGFANDLFQLKPMRMAEMVLVLVVSGYMISQIWSEWSVTNEWLKYYPTAINEYLNLNNPTITGITYGAFWFILIPILVWFVPFVVAYVAGKKQNVKQYYLNYGLAFLPIVAMAHAAKSIVKATDRIPYFEYLFNDPIGTSTAHQLINKQIILQQNPVWLNTLVSFFLIAFLVIGIWLSIKVVSRLNAKNAKMHSSKSFYLIPIIYGSIFLIMLLVWRWS